MSVRPADESGLLDDEAGSAEGDATDSAERDATHAHAPVALLRIAALVSVPLLWGSYTPALKLLLNQRHAPPAVLTNLASHVVGFLVLSAIGALQRCRCAAAAGSSEGDQDEPREPPPWSRKVRASVELGVYLFFGQLTQLLGLVGTSAMSNAILVQASVVVVPLLDPPRDAGGGRVRSRLARLLPSVLALAGVALITSAPADDDEGDGSEDTWVGIGLSLASAAFYALHTLRLTHFGDVDATTQAIGQVGVNTLLDLLALPIASLVPGSSATAWLATARHGARRRLALAALWNGALVVGLTTWSMSYAQQAFSASTAALAYAMEPLFAAVFAAAVLGDRLRGMQLAGGSLVVGANLIAAVGLRGLLKRLGLVA